MTSNEVPLTLERLETLLDAYGGDLERWPSGEAAAARALMARSPEAAALAREASALDRVLAQASGPRPERLLALSDRILSAASAESRDGAAARVADPARAARIVRLPVPQQPAASRAGSIDPRVPAPASPRPAPRHSQAWRAAAALAASLLVGVAIGLTDIAQTSALALGGSFSAASETEVVLAALQLDGVIAPDEDL